jgi:sarcosine oxidase subunit gamma
MNRGVAWIEDAPPLRRVGVKGPRAAALLGELGYTVPGQPNSWAPLAPADRDDSDNVIARLGNTEFFIEAAGDAGAALDARIGDGAYAVLREDVALRIGGADAAAALAEVCNVDFAPAPAGRPIYLTLMIGVGVLVLPQRRDDGRVFRIWCDPSFGPYLREELETVIQRKSGRSP